MRYLNNAPKEVIEFLAYYGWSVVVSQTSANELTYNWVDPKDKDCQYSWVEAMVFEKLRLSMKEGK